MSGAREVRDDGGGLPSKHPRRSAVQEAWIDLLAEVGTAEVPPEDRAELTRNVDTEDTR